MSIYLGTQVLVTRPAKKGTFSKSFQVPVADRVNS